MNPVTTLNQSIENIKKFNEEAFSYLEDKENSDAGTLVKNIPHYRAWYSVYDPNTDSYIFAPSKYIGYNGIDAITYSEKYTELDGRQTENVLSTWYETISKDHEKYDLLSKQLREFCTAFDKVPNSLFRINIPLNKQTNITLETNVTEFIWNAFQNLSEENRKLLKIKINRYRS